MSDKLQYFAAAARHSRYNAAHWLRYLRKVICGKTLDLSAEEAEELIAAGKLTMYQQISLKRALIPGTATNLHVRALNAPAQTSLLEEVIRRHKSD